MSFAAGRPYPTTVSFGLLSTLVTVVVAAIADAHGAKIATHAQPEGGLRIQVSFPGRLPDAPPTLAVASEIDPQHWPPAAVMMALMRATFANSTIRCRLVDLPAGAFPLVTKSNPYGRGLRFADPGR